MSTRQNKKRKGRNHVNNRERTVTTFTEDPNTSFLVPLSSEDPPAFAPSSFSMPYQNYVPPHQQQFFQPVIPPGKNDLEILENLKNIIKEGQHEFYRAVPQPAALASLYIGPIPQHAHSDQLSQEYPAPRFSQDATTDGSNALDSTSQSVNNTVEAHTPLSGADTSPQLGADASNVSEPNSSPVKPDPDDTSRFTPEGPAVDPKMDTPGEYDTRQPMDTNSPDKAAPLGASKDDEPSQVTGEHAWERRTLDDRKESCDDRNANLPSTYDNRPSNGPSATTTIDSRLPPQEDRRFYDRDRDRDRDRFIDRDRDRHDPTREIRDRDRDRDVRDRRPEFFGRSYGRSHAPRPPPELRHYEPSYGADYVPPPRRYDSDERRGALRGVSFDDRFRQPPFDDARPSFDDRRPPPPSTVDNRRLTLDDRPIRPPRGSDTRALLPSSEDRVRPAGDSMPPIRATAEDNRAPRATSLVADDRPRANVPLEERLSQPVPTPSLQDRLSQPVPARVDIPSAPTLEERLSLGPVPPRVYAHAPSVARDDLRAPLSKDDLRDHDRITDFRTNRDFTRERTSAPLSSASTYRPDLERNFGDRDDRDRRDRDITDVDAPSARFGDAFGRGLPPRRYSPPLPVFDRDRDRERGRTYYPTRSPPPFRGEGAYDPEGERRYATDRERDAYEQRRRDWYGPGEDDKRGPAPPPPVPWRPHERPPFVVRNRERFDRSRERDRDVRERERERERDQDLGGLAPPPTRGHWDDRDRRGGFPLSPPLSRIETTANVGPNRSLSARLTDPYPPPGSGGSGNDERTYAPPREFDRGRYGGPALDDHAHPFSRIRNRSPSPPRRGLAEDMRPPMKRMREDSGPGYLGGGLGAGGGGGGAAYSPPRRGVGAGMGGGGAGEYAPGPPPSSAATTSVVTSVSGTLPPRSTGTRTPPIPTPSSAANGSFYDRERERERDQRERERERERERDQRERDRDREYIRGEYGMGYDRDGRGRRSPPLLGSRMGPAPGSAGGGGGYSRGVVGDRRDDRRYIPQPPSRTN